MEEGKENMVEVEVEEGEGIVELEVGEVMVMVEEESSKDSPFFPTTNKLGDS